MFTVINVINYPSDNFCFIVYYLRNLVLKRKFVDYPKVIILKRKGYRSIILFFNVTNFIGVNSK